MRIDLHCHSKHSKRPTLWIMKKLGCPESFSEPVELYHLARQCGMDWVTISDHNVIDGCLEIADLPNTFISCEYTSYFPEDRCKVHVLAHQISEEQHRTLSQARENLFDLVDCLRAEGIPHACAHPLYAVNERLELHHIERLLLLFQNWEWNGSCSPDVNASTRDLLRQLTPQDIDRLREKHDIHPHFTEPWGKNLIGGSDDHCLLYLANCHTEVPLAQTLDQFWSGISLGQARIHGQPANPLTMGRQVYAIAYQFQRSKLRFERNVNKDLVLQFLDKSLRAQTNAPDTRGNLLNFMLQCRPKPKRPNPSGGMGLLDLARIEAGRLIRQDPQLKAIVRGGPHGDVDHDWFDFVNRISNRLLMHSGRNLLDQLFAGRLFEVFNSLGSAGALYTLLAPYLVSFGVFAQQRAWGAQVLETLSGKTPHNKPRPTPRIVHFTDTLYEMNGVARTLIQHLETAAHLQKDYTVITCLPDEAPTQPGVQRFSPVGSYVPSEYAELNLLWPPFIEMLKRCYDERFTHIHIATPGPVGWTGLAIARILQLPVSGTYHTAFPQYAKALTEDGFMEEALWRFVIWFYEQMDFVYVPSHSTGTELVQRGISPHRIQVYPRGVDTDRFHPRNRNGILHERFGIAQDKLTLLYVGRISKEKNLHILAEAYARAAVRHPELRLLLVGDGPFRAEMEAALSGLPAVFTGYVEGEDLDALYASSDLFVFPSATDTFGNVVLEAQASGLPVIVCDKGGPRENMLPGETGLIVPADDARALATAIHSLAEDPERRSRMGRAARKLMKTRGFQEAFVQLYDMYCRAQIHPKPAGLDAKTAAPSQWASLAI